MRRISGRVLLLCTLVMLVCFSSGLAVQATDYEPGSSYKIEVSPDETVKDVSPFIHSQVLCHPRNTFGLVWDDGPAMDYPEWTEHTFNPQHVQNELGEVKYNQFFKDSLDDMHPGILCFRGGYFRAAIGPRNTDSDDLTQRPRTPSDGLVVDWWAWNNHFGTDEFVRLARQEGAEPMLGSILTENDYYPRTTIVDNVTTFCDSQAWDKAVAAWKHWVEYCNVPVDLDLLNQAETYGWSVTTWDNIGPTASEVEKHTTSPLCNSYSADNPNAPSGYFAWLRYKIGTIMGFDQTAPYNIKYWKVGNEEPIVDFWHGNPSPYIAHLVDIVNAMKSVDSTINIGIDTSAPGSAWNQAVMGTSGLYRNISFLDCHTYSGQQISDYGCILYLDDATYDRSVHVTDGGSYTITVNVLVENETTHQQVAQNIRLKVDNQVVDFVVGGNPAEWATVVPSSTAYTQLVSVPISLGSNSSHSIKLERTASGSNWEHLRIAWARLDANINEQPVQIFVRDDQEYKRLIGGSQGLWDLVASLQAAYPDKRMFIGESGFAVGACVPGDQDTAKGETLFRKEMSCALATIDSKNELLRAGIWAHTPWHLLRQYRVDRICSMHKSNTDDCSPFYTDPPLDYPYEGDGIFGMCDWPVHTNNGDIGTLTPTYTLLQAYAKYAKGKLATCNVTSRQFGASTNEVSWWRTSQGQQNVALFNYVDAIAVKDGVTLRILVTNKDSSDYEDFPIVLDGQANLEPTCAVHIYAGSSANGSPLASQTVDVTNDDAYQPSNIANFNYTIPAASLVVFEFREKAMLVSPDGDDQNDGATWATAKATVQGAINAASSGYEVWVKQGTYNENIEMKNGVSLYGGFLGNEAVRSQRDAVNNATVLDGGYSGSVVTVPSSVTSGTVLDGFTVTNGYGLYGGGVYAQGSATISNNVITWNTGDSAGGGIACSDGTQCVITGNLIQFNSAYSGGGISCQNGEVGYPIISNNVIDENCGGGIYALSPNAAVISNNLISYNADYVAPGVLCGMGTATIAGNTIVGSCAWGGAAGAALYIDESTEALVANNIIASNDGGIYDYYGQSLILSHNDVWDNTSYNYSSCSAGSGDISADPLFADAANWDFHLASNSPCINAGADANTRGDRDIDGQCRIFGSHADMGCDEWMDVNLIHVDSSGGSDNNDGSTWASAKATLPAAISVSGPSTEIWVKEGTYTGNITLKGGASLYGGFDGTETARNGRHPANNVTTLDGDGSESVVEVGSGTTNTVVDGFTITNADYGILCDDGSGIVASGNTLTGNNWYGIVCLDGSTATIVDNKVTNNGCSGIGTNAYTPGYPVIARNVIAGNTYEGIEHYCGVDSVVYSNLIASNGDCGFYGDSTSALLYGNTIVGNSLGFYGYDCTLANNVVAYNQNWGVYQSGGSLTLTHNDVYGCGDHDYCGCSAGTGDISSDPLFVDYGNGDYRLKISPMSPCIDTGDNGYAPEYDILGVSRPQDGDGNSTSVCDMGCYEHLP